jgi:hypothetical protein
MTCYTGHTLPLGIKTMLIEKSSGLVVERLSDIGVALAAIGKTDYPFRMLADNAGGISARSEAADRQQSH